HPEILELAGPVLGELGAALGEAHPGHAGYAELLGGAAGGSDQALDLGQAILVVLARRAGDCLVERLGAGDRLRPHPLARLLKLGNAGGMAHVAHGELHAGDRVLGRPHVADQRLLAIRRDLEIVEPDAGQLLVGHHAEHEQHGEARRQSELRPDAKFECHVMGSRTAAKFVWNRKYWLKYLSIYPYARCYFVPAQRAETKGPTSAIRLFVFLGTLARGGPLRCCLARRGCLLACPSRRGSLRRLLPGGGRLLGGGLAGGLRLAAARRLGGFVRRRVDRLPVDRLRRRKP